MHIYAGAHNCWRSAELHEKENQKCVVHVEGHCSTNLFSDRTSNQLYGGPWSYIYMGVTMETCPMHWYINRDYSDKYFKAIYVRNICTIKGC